MQKIIAVAVMLFIPLSAASGGTISQIERTALINFQHELSQCAAFFDTTAGCLKDSDKTKKEFRGLTQDMMNQAVIVGQKISMTVETMHTRFRLVRESLISDINGKCANLSVLVERHFETCVNVTKMGQKRIMYWRHKAQESAADETQR